MNYQDWKQTAIGRFINTDGWYGSQCVDVLMDYAKALFPGHDWPELLGYGNAKDLFNTANPAFFDKIPNDHNDPNQLPLPGDIMIYGATQWNEFGHCGVCDGADSGGVNLIQQDGTYDPNGDGNADGTCFEKYRPWGTSVCIGWLRPRPQTAAPQPQQLLGYQRVVCVDGAFYRKEPRKSGEAIDLFKAGEVADFKGFVRGESVDGNNIWFVGRYTGFYSHSSGYDDSGTHDLDDLTPAPQPVPQPETPAQPVYSVRPSTGLFVPDVSSYQGDIDWPQLRGIIDSVIVKVGHTGPSYGGNENKTDPKFTQNQAAARNIGLEPHYYYYPYADEPVADEANRFMVGIGTLQSHEALWADVEDPNMTEEWLTEFLQKVETAAKRRCHLIIGWQYAVDRPWLANFAKDGRKVIIMHYGREAEADMSDTPLGSPIGHQYSETGQLPGISGKVDLSRIDCSLEAWRALADPLPEPPTQEPQEPEPQPSLPAEPITPHDNQPTVTRPQNTSRVDFAISLCKWLIATLISLFKKIRG